MTCFPDMRGRRNTVELVLFEISNSMKPCPSVFHACASKLRPAIGFFEPTNLDEVSNRIPPTSHDALCGRLCLGYGPLRRPPPTSTRGLRHSFLSLRIRMRTRGDILTLMLSTWCKPPVRKIKHVPSPGQEGRNDQDQGG